MIDAQRPRRIVSPGELALSLDASHQTHVVVVLAVADGEALHVLASRVRRVCDDARVRSATQRRVEVARERELLEALDVHVVRAHVHKPRVVRVGPLYAHIVDVVRRLGDGDDLLLAVAF